jgi:tetratricopeptide (TPR) repeat protein
MFLWREDDPEANVTRTVDAATAALRLVPGDPTLYFLRGFYEGFYRNDLTRARVDADKLAELLGQTNLVVWNEMNLAFVEQDYEKILELSQKLDQSVPGYGIPFSYRQTALALTGDFERIQKEIYQGEVSDQSVFGLPFWDTMGALTYEIQGDTEHYQQAVERVRTNRDLESSVSFITGIPSPPVAFYLLGGYIAELSDETLRAVLIYQSGLQIDPENYLLNWRRGVLSAKSGNIQDAYKAFQKARDNAPVPFPIAVYQQAQLIHTTPEAVPAEAPAPCELLRQARLQAKESPGFYAPLLTTIIQAEGDWACLAIYGG